MSFVFQDRESAYPNRYLVTKDDGTNYYIVLERADEPVVVGTPLNAETFNAMIEELMANAGIPAPATATAGQYLRVKAVDENGIITETETAAAEGGGGGSSSVVTAIDFTNFTSGSFTETVDGAEVSHSVTFDSEGRPATIDGVAITWGDM